jgi:Domain of unknown function (DUF4352)
MQLKPITAIVVLFLVVASLLISGCTSSTSPTATPAATIREPTVTPTADRPSIDQITTPTETPTAATPTPTAAPSKPTATGFVTLEVNDVTRSSQLGSYPLGSTAQPGKTFIVFDVTLTNENKNNLLLGNPLYFKLTTYDGTVYAYSPSSYWLPNGFKTGIMNTNPGDKTTGQIAFEIPQSAIQSKLSYGDAFNGVVTVDLAIRL